MTNLTFIIPDYLGLELLKKNLPSVIAEALAGDQLIISHDGPLTEEQKENYQAYFQTLNKDLKQKKIDFLFICQKENLRFAKHVNEIIKSVKYDFFFLLNNDVRLTKGARDNLLKTIKTDEKIFAVTAKEVDSSTKEPAGRNLLWWQRGRFWHSKDKNLEEKGQTAWACGGSSLYRKKIWQALAGFDDLYYPAYWEDIDLSFRAKKKGYQIIYQPQAVVIHEHETTNRQAFGEEKMKTMSWNNGSRFAWKNSRWQQKLSFLLYYPYWLFKQFPAYKWWLVILLTALILRLANLGEVPPGLTVDEAAIAYNGYSIWVQRRDEWLNRLPISFRSYGDYKAPLPIYLNGFFTALGGLNPTAIRLPFVLANVFSLYFFMKIIDLLWREKTPKSKTYAAVAGLFMSLTPWHFHYGRLGFENNFALLFITAGIYFLLSQIKMTRTKRGQLFSQQWLSGRFLLAGISLALALYSYHSSKVFLPGLLFFLLIFYRHYWQKNWRLCFIPLVLSLILISPLLKDSFFGQGLTRANSSYLFDQQYDGREKLLLMVQGLSSHLTGKFLIGGQLNAVEINNLESLNMRHGDNHFGVLNLPLLFLITLSLINYVRFSIVRKEYQEIYLWGLVWIILGLFSASLTTQIPHSNQALLALPGFIILATLGLSTWNFSWQKNQQFSSSLKLLLIFCVCLSFLLYHRHYYQVFSSSASTENYLEKKQASYLFAQNLLEAFALTKTMEKEKEEIIVAVDFEHPYLYALLARKTKPVLYQSGSLSERYVFIETKANLGHLERNKRLIVVTPNKIENQEHFDRTKPLKIFYDLNKEPNLYLYESFE